MKAAANSLAMFCSARMPIDDQRNRGGIRMPRRAAGRPVGRPASAPGIAGAHFRQRHLAHGGRGGPATSRRWHRSRRSRRSPPLPARRAKADEGVPRLRRAPATCRPAWRDCPCISRQRHDRQRMRAKPGRRPGLHLVEQRRGAAVHLHRYRRRRRPTSTGRSARAGTAAAVPGRRGGKPRSCYHEDDPAPATTKPGGGLARPRLSRSPPGTGDAGPPGAGASTRHNPPTPASAG